MSLAEEVYDPIYNPFSVRYVQPGAIPFHFDTLLLERFRAESPDLFRHYLCEAISLRQEASTWVGCRLLAERLEQTQFRGQIFGPHGSGKSTLMCSLRPALEAIGCRVFTWELHDQQSFLTGEFWDEIDQFLRSPDGPRSRQEANVLFLDGFEQLSFIPRMRLRKYCRDRKMGLVLTTHLPVFGLPILFKTAASLETVRHLVHYLVDDESFTVGEEDVKALYAQNRGNCRTILFDLYDRFEDTYVPELGHGKHFV